MPRPKHPKAASDYRRGMPTREPYDVVLIACEGRKTEPNYLKGLRMAYGLSSVNVRVLEPPGQDSLSIVNFAIGQLDRDQEYDRAYCVFDRDGHANFDAAVRLARETKYSVENKLFAIPSVPCFELWVLLHYCYSTAAYAATGGLSACERVIRDVKQHCPNYTKANDKIFNELAGNMNLAIKNAVRLEKHNSDTGTSNPATRVHHLVDYLINLKT